MERVQYKTAKLSAMGNEKSSALNVTETCPPWRGYGEGPVPTPPLLAETAFNRESKAQGRRKTKAPSPLPPHRQPGVNLV